MKTQIYPDFIGIGAPKCGTTWLSNILLLHPEIFVAHKKEVLFFSDKFDKGCSWYLDHFLEGANKKSIGEFSVNYMHSSGLPAKKMHNFNPSLKLIVMLRDPIRRSFSHYRWMKQIGKIPENISFTDAIKDNSDILEYSLYYKNLKPFIELFGMENLHIIKYENISRDPEKIQSNIFNFLGVDSRFDSKITKKVIGKTISPRYRVLENIRVGIHKFAVRNNYDWSISFIKKTGIPNLYRLINDKRNNTKILSKEEYESFKEFFEEDINNLKLHYNIDDEEWMKWK